MYIFALTISGSIHPLCFEKNLYVDSIFQIYLTSPLSKDETRRKKLVISFTLILTPSIILITFLFGNMT